MTARGAGRGKRVVITGAGTINPLGGDSVPATTLEAMREGRCGIGDARRSAMWTGWRSSIGGQVQGL